MSAKNISNTIAGTLVVIVVLLVGIGLIRLVFDNLGYLVVFIVMVVAVSVAVTKLKS